MEWAWSFLIWLIVILSSVFFFLRSGQKSGGDNRRPPGPPGWPVFGHMFDLGIMPHKTLAGFRDQYGPVVWLKLGSINTIVILTAKAATEFFKNHDLSFAERTVIETMRSHRFNSGSVALAPYGTYWRVLKRIMTVEMLVQKRINETVSIRRKCVDDMLSWIEKEANTTSKEAGATGIHVSRFVFFASFNMLGNLMVSRDLVDPQSQEGSDFFNATIGLMEWTGHPNIVDVFPWLSWFDPQGLRRRMDRDLGKALKIAGGFVEERLKEKKKGCRERKDFLDVLIEFEGDGKDEPAKISEHDLNIIILEVFLAGSETTSSSIEWAMTELLLHPEKMIKVKDELSKVIGPNRKLEESDIDNLPYLKAVVKETLRLHPPIPFLVPRKAIQDAEFMGYHIPKNTQVFVNAWAIGRDTEFWNEPLCFMPERFLGSKIEYKGQHFGFIPFGAGRRMCAGIPLAHCMLHLVLGSLLKEFDWELDGRVITRDTMDMNEIMGVTTRKMEPLKAVASKCEV